MEENDNIPYSNALSNYKIYKSRYELKEIVILHPAYQNQNQTRIPRRPVHRQDLHPYAIHAR